MAARVISAIVTLIVISLAAFIIFFGMIVAMNGFSEREASWGLGAFLLISVFLVAVLSVGAFILAGILVNRQFRPAVACVIVIPAFSILGMIVVIVSSIIGIAIANYVRVNY